MKKKSKFMQLCLTMIIFSLLLPYHAGATKRSEKSEGIGYVSIENPYKGISSFLYNSRNKKKALSLSDNTKKQITNALKETWDNFDEKCDLSAYHIIYQEGFFDFIYEILHDGRYYYVEVGRARIGRNGTLEYVEFTYNDTKQNVKEKKVKYETAVAKALEGVNPLWSDFEKALYLNDYLAANTCYDETYSRYSAYDALVEGTSVCEGYARAYKVLLNEVGVPCEQISSDSLNHAWNLVQINGNTYHVDVTWNDPLGNPKGLAEHKYFMKSNAYMRSEEADHYVLDDWKTSGEFCIAEAMDTTYDTWMQNINTAFLPRNGKWYNYNGTNAIAEYEYRNNTFLEGKSIITVNDRWDYVNESGEYFYYLEPFMGYTTYAGQIYYSTSDKIYQLYVENGGSEVIYELSSMEDYTGNIVGINIDEEGTLYYSWQKGNNFKNRETKKALILSDTKEVENDKMTCYRVIFDGNGESITSEFTEELFCLYDTEYALTPNAFTKAGYVFMGWNTMADGSGISYKDGETIKNMTAQNYGKITLYAQWEKEKVTENDEKIDEDTTSDTDKTSDEEQTSDAEDIITKTLKKGKTLTLKIPKNKKKVSWKIVSNKKCIKVIKKTKTSMKIKGIKKGTVKISGKTGNRTVYYKIKVQ